MKLTNSELRIVDLALQTDIKEINRLIERLGHDETLELCLQEAVNLQRRIQKYLEIYSSGA